MKGLIVYKGKYGATMQYGIWLGAALDCPVANSDNVRPDQVTQADYLLIGSSVYIGQLQIKQWLHANIPLLEGKKIIFFIVAGGVPDKPEEVRSYFEKCVPAVLKANATCFYLPGRLYYAQLSLTDKILLRIGAWFAARKGQHITLTDYNNVSREHLAPVIAAARLLETASFTPQKTVL